MNCLFLRITVVAVSLVSMCGCVSTGYLPGFVPTDPSEPKVVTGEMELRSYMIQQGTSAPKRHECLLLVKPGHHVYLLHYDENTQWQPPLRSSVASRINSDVKYELHFAPYLATNDGMYSRTLSSASSSVQQGKGIVSNMSSLKGVRYTAHGVVTGYVELHGLGRREVLHAGSLKRRRYPGERW